jgi:hypothetical protein
MTEVYEQEMAPLLPDLWQARDDYISVILDRSPENVERFLARHAGRRLDPGEKIKALRLLEMQRHAMLMFTSCGWFFDEISGLETAQVLEYAARATQLAERASGATLEPAFRLLLEHAPSNLPEYGNGAQVYEKLVKPAMIDLMRVGAHYAVSSLFEDYQETTGINCYTAAREFYDLKEAGRQKLAIGRARMRSNITWSEKTISFAVRRIYDHNYPIMQVMRELNIPLPQALSTPAEYVLNANLRRLLETEDPDLDQLRNLLDEARKWGFKTERAVIGFAASNRFIALMERLWRDPNDLRLLNSIETLLKTLQPASIDLDLMKAQRLYLHLARQYSQEKRNRAEEGDQNAREWAQCFDALGNILRVRS